MNKIIVNSAQVVTAIHPCTITTFGLGSCIGITLYDLVNKNSGMAHIMLPSLDASMDNQNPGKFADKAIEMLLQKMLNMGSERKNLVAKIAGGAKIVSLFKDEDTFRIGEKNIIATKNILRQLRVPIVAEDVGGSEARTITLSSDKGELAIKKSNNLTLVI